MPIGNETVALAAIGRDRPYQIIAIFEKIEDANIALASLIQAADAGESWDAHKFKQDNESKQSATLATRS